MPLRTQARGYLPRIRTLEGDIAQGTIGRLLFFSIGIFPYFQIWFLIIASALDLLPALFTSELVSPLALFLLHRAVVGTKYALLTDAEMDSLRYEVHDDGVLASNQLSGWMYQPPDLVFMHASKAEARVGRDLHVQTFKLEAPITRYPSHQVALLAKDAASYFDQDNQDHADAAHAEAAYAHADDTSGVELNAQVPSHPDHANGEEGDMCVFSMALCIFASSVERIPNNGITGTD